jgi:hypothetical protein
MFSHVETFGMFGNLSGNGFPQVCNRLQETVTAWE